MFLRNMISNSDSASGWSRRSVGGVCLAALLIIGTAGDVASAKPSSDDDDEGVVSTYDVFGKGKKKIDSGMQTLGSDFAMRTNDVNRAIKTARRAVQLDPDDVDARVSLGEALFEKVHDDKAAYPEQYNECVKTWLTVYRNLVGEETGMNYKGIGIPGFRTLFEDEDRSRLAKDRLIDLCGRVPKAWETNKKFLDKVLIPQETVSGKILKKDDKDRNADAGTATKRTRKVSNNDELLDVDRVR